MKQLICAILFFVSFNCASQTVLGKWKSIDRYGVSKCVVDIYKENGKVYGKITEILVEEEKASLCEKCEGEEKNKPLLGLVIIKDLKKAGKYYKNGTIFDPEHGDEFRCRIALENNNTLQVRGYLSFIHATQYWIRVEGKS